MDILKLIQNIQTKIDVILETLQLIANGEYDYDAIIEQSIKLPIDISQYALNTKSMNILQIELMELLQYLSESTNSPQQWIQYLKDDDFEIYNRLCSLSDRLWDKENKQYLNDNDEDKEDDEDELDEDMLYPLSALCQLLATFGSLSPSEFAPMLKQKIFKNVILSLVNHRKLNSDDTVIRLQSIVFIICNIDGVFTYSDDNNHDMWFYKILVDLLLSEYEPVLMMITKCISFYIAKLENIENQKQCLLYLQTTLKGDDFRHFTEHYFLICNQAQWNEDDIESKLLIQFVNHVINNDIKDFFFSSDLKVLIDIYERTLHYVNINWNGYDSELQSYHYDELCVEIK